MTRDWLVDIMQYVGWGLIAGLCLVVGLLWIKLDRQVSENQANIAVLQRYADERAERVREESAAAQARLENRWGTYLMPLLRQHHRALQGLHGTDEPLPEWLRE